MELLIIGGLWLLNAVISTVNSFAVGFMFRRRNASTWEKFMAWCGYIMAGSGYSWCIIILLAFGAMALGFLTPASAVLLLNIGYVVIIPGILFTGYVIVIDSVIRATRQRSVGSVAVAGYNIFATGYNTYNAFRFLPKITGDVFKAFSGGSNKQNALVLVLAICALLSGFLLSGVIVWKVSQSGE